MRRPLVGKCSSVHCFEHYQTTDARHQCLISRAVLIHPHSIDARGKMIKTGRESEESLYFLDLLCDSRALFLFPFEISKATGLAGSFIPVTKKGLCPPI